MSLASTWAATRAANELTRPAPLTTLKTAEDLMGTASVDDKGNMVITVGNGVLKMRGPSAVQLAEWITATFGDA